MRYEDGGTAAVERVLVSAQHAEESFGQLREDLARVVVASLVEVSDERLIVTRRVVRAGRSGR